MSTHLYNASSHESCSEDSQSLHTTRGLAKPVFLALSLKCMCVCVGGGGGGGGYEKEERERYWY